MSLHVFASFVTPFGTAANNRGETEGNTTTLQKLIWYGQPHTTVSAESIRFALRRRLNVLEESGANRRWDENERYNTWQDKAFSGWSKDKGTVYIDDDLLGFMLAEAAKEENTPGSTTVRRAVLEVARAISLTPWPGDMTFNAASPGATGSAAKGAKPDRNPVPYGAEMHATRYQYSVAMTPQRLRDVSRAGKALTALCQLGPVAGNHGRFLFDFSPESAVFRITEDPAPRLLYCFESDDGRTVDVPSLVERVQMGDIDPKELILGGPIVNSPAGQILTEAGAFVPEPAGARAACNEAVNRINSHLKATAK
jgi:CRISPR-associated protein Cst2